MQYYTNDDRSAWDATDFLIAQGYPCCPKGTKTTIGGISTEYAQFILGGLLIKGIISTSNSNVFEIR